MFERADDMKRKKMLKGIESKFIAEKFSPCNSPVEEVIIKKNGKA